MIQLARLYPVQNPDCDEPQARTIIVSVGSEEKRSYVAQLGADVVINYKNEDFERTILQATNGKGVDILIDFVGGPNFQKNINSIGLDGKMIVLGFLGGPLTPTHINISPILKNRIKIIGTTLRGRSIQYKEKLSQEFSSFLNEHYFQKVSKQRSPKKSKSHSVAPSRLRITIDSVYSFEDIEKAHQKMSDNATCGKLVVKGFGV
eukprot:Sdes_comp19102_c0_seq1m9773